MTNFYVTYKFADKEIRDKFYAEVRECSAAEKTRKEDGCIRYEFFYHADCDDKMFLWEQWDSRQAQKKHLEQPHYLQLAKIKEKYGVQTDILVED